MRHGSYKQELDVSRRYSCADLIRSRSLTIIFCVWPRATWTVWDAVFPSYLFVSLQAEMKMKRVTPVSDALGTFLYYFIFGCQYPNKVGLKHWKQSSKHTVSQSVCWKTGITIDLHFFNFNMGCGTKDFLSSQRQQHRLLQLYDSKSNR